MLAFIDAIEIFKSRDVGTRDNAPRLVCPGKCCKHIGRFDLLQKKSPPRTRSVHRMNFIVLLIASQ